MCAPVVTRHPRITRASVPSGPFFPQLDQYIRSFIVHPCGILRANGLVRTVARPLAVAVLQIIKMEVQ